MNLQTETFEDVIVVHAPDDLGGDHAEDFSDFVSTLELTQIVVDLDGTEMIDSAGLTALLDSRDALHERGGELKVATTNSNNRKILEITQLDRQLEVFDTVVGAVRAFR